MESTEQGFIGLIQHDFDVLAGAAYNLENDVGETTTGQGFSFSPAYFYGYNEALALATREGDSQWTGLVRWLTFATIYAEEKDIADESSAIEMPVVDLFGSSYKHSFLGNYGDMYERNLGGLIPRSGQTC